MQVDDVPVTETWEEAAGANALLILLDRVTAPPPLRREDWKALIDQEGSPALAFTVLEDCAYPKLLERRPFLSAPDPLIWERAVETWLAPRLPGAAGLEPAPLAAEIPGSWWAQLVDSPGHAETADPAIAQAFAQQARGHFQNVVWLGCAGRDAALVRAELEYRRAASTRALIVLAYNEKAWPLPSDRHSYLRLNALIPAAGPENPVGACYAPAFPGWLARELGGDLSQAIRLASGEEIYRLAEAPPAGLAARQTHLEILQRYFRRWKDDPQPCRDLTNEVSAAVQHGFEHDWERGAELARRAAFHLLSEGRRREGIRLFHRLRQEAESRGDAETAADAQHELSWLNEEDEPARAESVTGEQLALTLF